MTRGAWTGLALAILPGSLGAAAMAAINPWFLDRPALFAVLALAAPATLLTPLAGAILKDRGLPAAKPLAAALGAIYVAACLRPAPAPDGVEVVVVGVDGATFEIIDPMVASGELPAFAAMQAAGSRGVLRSMEPMFSPLLWTTIASGKRPEQHGIHGFHVQADHCQVPRFWDIAEDGGKSIGVFKWLVTYPPREVDGFIVPAWLAPERETWPADLSFLKEIELSNRLKRQRAAAVRSNEALVIEGLKRGFRFGTVLDAVVWTLRERVSRPSDDERHLALQILRGKMDRDVFIWALNEHNPQVATFTYYATDGLAHRFWRQFEPTKFEGVTPGEIAAFGDAVPDAYRQADAILGEIVAAVGDEARVFIVSDHGFQAFRPGLGRAAFTPGTERLRARMSEAVGEVDISKLGVKLNVGLVDDALDIERARAWLEGLTDSRDRPVFRVEDVPDNHRALGLTYADEAFDEDRLASDTVGGEPMADYITLDEPDPGVHEDNGVFYARGPGVPAGEELPDVSLLDVAPTVQAALGIAPAADLEGEVLFFDGARGPESRDNLAKLLIYGDGADGANEDMLRELGYIE